MPPNCRPVVLFLGLAGCRFSEMCALRVDDVVQTPHGLGVRIHRAAPQSKRTSGAVFGPTKSHQTRTVPVPLTLETYVRDRIEREPSGSYLYPSPTGAIWTNTNFRVRSNWTETKSVASPARRSTTCDTPPPHCPPPPAPTSRPSRRCSGTPQPR
jgi:integrase